jgi:hypothetical protein
LENSTFDRLNAACGALFIVIGAFFAWHSLDLDIGTSMKMGPGYFPLVVSLFLVLLGAVILIQAFRIEGEPLDHVAWRGMVFILPSPILFGLTVRGLGFIPAIFLTALFASMASFKMKAPLALILSACVTIFSTVVFVMGLGLPFRLFGPWVGG